jgi:hypothetical protein
MGRITLLVFLTLRVMCAQNPQIIEYPTAPKIKTARLGLFTCNFYSQYPGAGQEQTWCILNGTTIFNGISTINSNVAIVCSAVIPQANISWAFVPGSTGFINYQIAVQPLATGLPFQLTNLTVPPGMAAKGGSF